MNGSDAQALERNVLNALRERGINVASENRFKKFDGYSESWAKAALDVSSINELIVFAGIDRAGLIHKAGED
jgi:hypothetical protein